MAYIDPTIGFERESREIDPRPVVQSARTGPPARRIRVAVPIVAACLAVAIAKPWGGSQPPASTPLPNALAPAALATTTLGRGAAATTAPVADMEVVAVRDSCPDRSWLIVVDDVTVRTPTRSWTVVNASNAAATPADGSIPYTRIASSQIRSLGFCSPSGTIDATERWEGTLWRSVRTKAGSSSWEVFAQYSLMAGRMSSLLPGNAPSGGWETGRYVLEAQPTAGGGDVWIGLDLVTGT